MFSLPGEFILSVLINGNILNLVPAALLVFIFLTFTYFSSRTIGKIKSVAADIIYFIFYGLVGLIAIEWFFIGNSPWGNPSAGQLGMFAYWSAVAMSARILTDESSTSKLKKSMFVLFAIVQIISIIIGFILQVPQQRYFALEISIIGYELMILFYLWYFKIGLNKQKPK